MMISEKAFAGLSVMTEADLLQLPLVIRKLILYQFFDKYSMKHLLGLQWRHLFKYAELTEVVRQNDKLFINLLNKFHVGNIKMMHTIYSRQYLYMNLMKTTWNMPFTCTERMN